MFLVKHRVYYVVSKVFSVLGVMFRKYSFASM